ncbi:MAG: gamma-glutamyl-gamma-aminobutyrate hydrolase family protein [Pseudomonadota bacterium]
MNQIITQNNSSPFVSTRSDDSKVRIAFSPRILHAPGSDYGRFTRGAENIIRDNFKDVQMSAVMIDHKKRMIPEYIKNHEAFFLFGAAADIAEADSKGLHKDVKKRIKFEMKLTEEAIKNGKLIFGACGGMQSISKFLLGMKMDEYIPDIEHGGQFNHYGNRNFETAHPMLFTDKNSVSCNVAKKFGSWSNEKNFGVLLINSVHKQGFKVQEIVQLQKEINQYFQDKAPFTVNLSGYSPDGYVEAIEIREKNTEIPIIVLTQFHPEYRRFHPKNNEIIKLNEAEKTGRKIFCELKDTILQNRQQQTRLDTRQALLDFINYKKQQVTSIDQIEEKDYWAEYDRYKPSEIAVTQ